MITQLLSVFVFISIGYAYNKSGICHRTNVNSKHNIDGTTASYDRFCCDFYEKRNGNCFECPVGYDSRGGLPCVPCSSKTYGKFCVETCNCRMYQWCNHIDGCVSSLNARNITTDTGSPTTTKPITDRSSTDHQSEISSGLPIMYVLGLGVMVINIGFCIACAVYCKRKRHSNDVVITENAATDQVSYESIQDNVYDEIDEIDVTNEISNQEAAINIHDRELFVAVGASSANTHEEGYLNPYQPTVPFRQANYKNIPLVSQIQKCSKTSDDIFERYENTVIFN